jgi:DNA-binding transcriptional MerR regulator
MSPKGRGFISWSRYSLLPWIAAFLVASAMVSVAYYIFLSWDADTYWRAIGGALIEFALIVVLGAGFSQLLQASTDARTAAEEDRAKRLEFLRRLRAAHVQVAHSQKLLRIHDSGKTYTEQHRALMRTSPVLDEILMDLQEARNLFGEDQQTVTQAVEDLIKYLKDGEAEYERCHAAVSDAASVDHTKKLSDMNGPASDLTWTLDFARSGPGFREGYDEPLTAGKGTMRTHVYRQDRRE